MTLLRRSAKSERGLAVVATAAIAGILAFSGAIATQAATGDHSESSSRFLSGSLLTSSGTLDSLAALQGSAAVNEGVVAPDIDTNSLDLSALSALQVSLPGGISIPLGDLLELGAVNQYAEASDNGVSRSAAGAVSDAGIVDTTGTGAFPANASIDLMALLPNTSILDVANLNFGAVSGVAALDGGDVAAIGVECDDLSAPEHCRDYNIASAELNVHSNTVSGVVSNVNGALDIASAGVNGLNDEILGGVLDGVLDSLDLLGSIVPGVELVSNDLTVNTSVNLRTALSGVLATPLVADGVTINLGAGTITVDWEDVVGLNGLDPNTPLVSAATIGEVADTVGSLLGDLQTTLNTQITSLTNAATVTISGGVCLLEVVVCTAGLDISYSGALGALVDGDAALVITGTGGLALLSPVLTPLLANLQSAISDVISPLVGGIVATAGTSVSGFVTSAANALDPALELIGTVVGATVNVQEAGAAANSYREVAVRVALGTGLIATVDLGRAEVGANVLAAAAAVEILTPVAGTNYPVPSGGTKDVLVTGSGETGATVTVTLTPGGDSVDVPVVDGMWQTTFLDVPIGTYTVTASQNDGGVITQDTTTFEVSVESTTTSTTTSTSTSTSTSTTDSTSTTTSTTPGSTSTTDSTSTTPGTTSTTDSTSTTTSTTPGTTSTTDSTSTTTSTTPGTTSTSTSATDSTSTTTSTTPGTTSTSTSTTPGSTSTTDSTSTTTSTTPGTTSTSTSTGSTATSTTTGSTSTTPGSTSTTTSTSTSTTDAGRTPKATVSLKSIVRGTGVVQEIRGSGFKPGESVSGTLYSTPRALPAKAADSLGNVVWTVAIDSQFETGSHYADLVGAESGAVSAPNNTTQFTVTTKAGLANTGAATGWALPLILLLIAAGGGAVLVGERRQRDSRL